MKEVMEARQPTNAEIEAFLESIAPQHSIITLPLIKQICDNVQIGGYIDDAVVAAGVSIKTFYNWMDRGIEDDEAGRKSLYTSLLHAFKTVHAKTTQDLIAEVRQAPMFWQAKAWILERTRFAKFGNKQLVITEDVTGRVNIPPPASSYDAWLQDSRQTRQLPAPALTDDMLIAEAESVDVEEIEIVSPQDAKAMDRQE